MEDIEIARKAKLENITKIATKLGIDEEYIEQYGKYKAKISCKLYEKLEKKDLIRVVKNNENEVFVDLTGKANGRGAYIKKDIDVLNKARKSKILDKHLETTIDDSVYQKLEEIINQ